MFLLVAAIVGTTWGLLRADRAWKAEARRVDGERAANLKARARFNQLEKGIEFLESTFKGLDPQAEEKEGKTLRVILGERIAQRAEGFEAELIDDPLVVADHQSRLGLSLLYLGSARSAIPLFIKTRNARTKARGVDHQDTPTAMSALAEGYHAAGEPVLREACSTLDEKAPGSLPLFNAQSLWGEALLGQNKYAEAEPLLLKGFEGLKASEAQVASIDPNRLADAGKQIVRLYERWGKPEKAAEWRTKLARPDRSGPKS